MSFWRRFWVRGIIHDERAIALRYRIGPIFRYEGMFRGRVVNGRLNVRLDPDISI